MGSHEDFSNTLAMEQEMILRQSATQNANLRQHMPAWVFMSNTESLLENRKKLVD